MAATSKNGKSKQQAAEDNLKCATSLNEIFHLLDEANALVGRAGLTVVLDAQRLPRILAGDISLFTGYSLDAVGFGYLHCAAGAWMTEKYVFIDMSALSDEPVVWEGGEETPVPTNEEFPYVEEIRSAVYSIPELSGDVRVAIEASKRKYDEEIRTFLEENADEINKVLLSDAATDAPEGLLH